MPTHVFFDLDNTLMLSRTTMREDHQPLFKRLCGERDVIVVSGARDTQIRAQIPDSLGARFYILGQMGNHAIDPSGTLLWKEQFSDEQTKATLDVIAMMQKEIDAQVSDPEDLVELRGSQISYSVIGHNESRDKKYAFDPDQSLRRRVVSEHMSDVNTLNALGVDVVPGGTTCFDFFLAGKTKGFNVARLIEREGWKKEECIYIGDALFPGGNDETVVGVIPTKQVANPDETFDYLKTTFTE